MATITVTFTDDARIGRSHGVAPLVIDDMPEAIEAVNWNDVAAAVFGYARPRLASRDIDVELHQDTETATIGGTVFCGFQIGARFTITHTCTEVPDAD
jgi:hypothetical protein